MADSSIKWWPKPWLGILVLVLLLGFWFVGAQYKLFPELKFPYPGQVASSLTNLGYNLLVHSFYTISRVLVGLIVGSVFGFVVGLLMSYSRYVNAALDLLIELLRPIPPIALIPFFILWFGIGNTGKYLLISWGVFMIMVVSTIEAVKNVSPTYRRAAASLGASQFEIYRTVIVPAIIPALVGTMRVASAFAFGVTVAAEFMGANWGLGYMIITARRTLNTPSVLIGVVMIGLISWIVDQCIRRITTYVTRWTESE